LTTQFPPNATIDQKLNLIQGLLSECNARQAYCGDIPPPPPPGTPQPPVKYFYNVPKACSVKCPDGSLFTYTVAAGTFVSITQAIADSTAQAFACQQAALRKMCLGTIAAKACANVVYNQTVTETGGIGPFIWEISDGSLPTGLNIDPGTGLISGTPTVGTSYTFTVRVTSQSDGSYSTKNYSICVVDIGPSSSTLPIAAVGVPVVVVFSASSCASNPLSWQHIGSLPPGLSLDEQTGKLTGSPTTPGTYTFTIKVQDSAT
jgi:hypothetical protein